MNSTTPNVNHFHFYGNSGDEPTSSSLSLDTQIRFTQEAIKSLQSKLARLERQRDREDTITGNEEEEEEEEAVIIGKSIITTPVDSRLERQRDRDDTITGNKEEEEEEEYYDEFFDTKGTNTPSIPSSSLIDVAQSIFKQDNIETKYVVEWVFPKRNGQQLGIVENKSWYQTEDFENIELAKQFFTSDKDVKKSARFLLKIVGNTIEIVKETKPKSELSITWKQKLKEHLESKYKLYTFT